MIPNLTFLQLVRGLVFFNMLDDGGQPNFSGLSVTFQEGSPKVSWDSSTHSTRLSRWGKELTTWAEIGLLWANKKGFLDPEESQSLFPEDDDFDFEGESICLWRLELSMKV